MKRFASAFVLAATLVGSMAHAQIDKMVDRCGDLSMQEQAVVAAIADLQAKKSALTEELDHAQNPGDLRRTNADIRDTEDSIKNNESMLADIHEEMKSCM